MSKNGDTLMLSTTTQNLYLTRLNSMHVTCSRDLHPVTLTSFFRRPRTRTMPSCSSTAWRQWWKRVSLATTLMCRIHTQVRLASCQISSCHRRCRAWALAVSIHRPTKIQSVSWMSRQHRQWRRAAVGQE